MRLRSVRHSSREGCRRLVALSMCLAALPLASSTVFASPQQSGSSIAPDTDITVSAEHDRFLAGSGAQRFQPTPGLPPAVEGTVTNTAGTPQQNVLVKVQIYPGPEITTVTDAFGRYRLEFPENLDRVWLNFRPPAGTGLASTWYGRSWQTVQQDQTHGKPVFLARGVTTSGIDATLEPGFTISGTAKSADGSPLPGRNLLIKAVDPGNPAQLSGAASGQDGTFKTELLPAGMYTVWLSPLASDAGLVTTPYRENDGIEPTQINLQGTNVTGVNLALDHGTSLTGRVIDVNTGRGISDIWVSNDLTNQSEACSLARTDKDGYYTLSNMSPGRHQLVYWDHEDRYADRYSGHPYDVAADHSVTVLRDQVTKVADIRMDPGAVLKGRILLNPKAKDAWYGVEDIKRIPQNRDYTWANPQTGEFTIRGVQPGAQILRAEGKADGQQYSGFYLDADSEDLATPIHVQVGKEYTLEDWSLIRQTGLWIGVNYAEGVTARISSYIVRVYNLEGKQVATIPQFTASQHDSLPYLKLPEGSYKVKLESRDPAFPDHWYSFATSFENAAVVSAPAVVRFELRPKN